MYMLDKQQDIGLFGLDAVNIARVGLFPRAMSTGRTKPSSISATRYIYELIPADAMSEVCAVSICPSLLFPLAWTQYYAG